MTADASLRARWREAEERPLTPEAFAARAAVPLTPEERALITWFRARYPTAAARLAAHRRLELQQRPR
jgi:hypothetical protein